MAIIINEFDKIFTLTTKNSAYQMKVDKYGFLLHLYYGRYVEGNADFLLTYADRGFSPNPYCAQGDRTYSLDALPQEFPNRGNGDFRSPAVEIKTEEGAFGCDFRYVGYEVKKGKYGLEGLPAVYANDDESETLEITLEDKALNARATLIYGVLPERDIITRCVKITNNSAERIYVEKLHSASLDFVTGNFDIITFYGRHAMESNYQRGEVMRGNYRIGSCRGTSSHQYNPFMILADKETTEDAGKCYAMCFVYSGGFLGEVERDQFNQTRLQIGLSDEKFSYPLDGGEVLISPEAILTYSGNGLSKLSQNMHKCLRKHVCRGKYRDVVRPILVNSWEAAYFDFDGKTIINLAKEAAALGIETVVMDDGWFGKRNDDNSGLGDWRVNEEKLGCSLKEMVDEINGLGVKFGIWIEPEMVNEDSDLYRSHKDWVLAMPNREPVRGRNQLVLDFSRKEVVDAIYEQICSVIDQCNVEYIKWDMNRSITDVYTNGDKAQGKTLYGYVLGAYDFLERLNERYPHILIEGCSGGGGRFDAGMLYYTPQIWRSDNTDAIDRTKIQYGTSFCYPLSTMGAHVSAVPNHQTGRITPLKARAVTAMAGSFGYELDLGKLTKEEKEEIKRQVKDYHKYAELIYNGDYYRLSNPYEEEIAAWETVSEDKKEALLSYVTLDAHGNTPPCYLRLKGLADGKLYKDEKSGAIYSADILMETGLPLSLGMGEYLSEQILLVML